jgi:hypothetical protein
MRLENDADVSYCLIERIEILNAGKPERHWPIAECRAKEKDYEPRHSLLHPRRLQAESGDMADRADGPGEGHPVPSR